MIDSGQTCDLCHLSPINPYKDPDILMMNRRETIEIDGNV